MNYRELGLPAGAHYFNGGMLVADIDRWRRESLAEKMLDCLRRHRQHVLWWDQYALNVVLAGAWRALDHRWNQGSHVYAYPSWQESPFSHADYTSVRKSPWIVHFCSPSKPWHYFCSHPFTSEFRRTVAQTAWRDWQPARPQPFLSQWWDFHYLPRRRRWKEQVRSVKNTLRSAWRKAA
jgi:lipopolysaccharide biosynthesis glycosyltransferase